MTRRQGRGGAPPGAGSSAMAAFIDAFNTGLRLQQSGDLDNAEVAYRKAMRLNPKEAMLYNNLGVIAYTRGRMDEAVAFQQRAIALDPRSPAAHNNLGVTLNALNRHEEAVVVFSRSLEFDATNVLAYNNFGDSLNKLGRFEEGAATLERALALNPNYTEAYSNLGMAYWGLGRLEDAVASFRRAIALRPDLDMPHKNLGLVLLVKADFAEAWREYDHRWAADKLPPRSPRPRWLGQDLGDKTLLVWAEQGVGDEILHASMLPDLVARGMKVMWELDPRLVPLLQRSHPTVRVVGRRNPPTDETLHPDVVAQIPAASLGQYLRSDISQFPKDRNNFLVADANRSAALRAGLNLSPGDKLVGISWLSKNVTLGYSKTTALKDWADILRTPGVRFVDLQYGDTSEERVAVQNELGVTPAHVEGLDLRDDLDGMAALTAACDLVVTVSNTTAHVAGGLGVPVWVLVPAGIGKFWYWGHNSNTSLWYPSSVVIRQMDRHVWGQTLRAVAGRLADFVSQRDSGT